MKQSTLSFASPSTSKRPASDSDDAPRNESKKLKISRDPLAIPDPDFDISAMISQDAPSLIRKGDLDLMYFNPFISPLSKSKELFTYLRQELPWYRVCYTVRGSMSMPVSLIGG
jgi:hypothetical protein